MAGSIKGIIVEIGGDTTGLQKALSKVNSATSSLSRELRGINSLLKLDPSNTELLSQKQIVLNQEINKTEEKLKTLKTAQEEANKTLANGGEISQENYRALQREIINTENKLKQLKLEASNWTTSGKKIEEIGNKITSISSKVDNLGNKLTTRLTLPLMTLGVVGTKSAMEQESAMQQVDNIYGEASKTIENFAENTAISFNMSTKDAYKYSQIYGNLIQSITDDTEENAEYTQKLLKASAIIASSTGRTMEDVMDRIRSGLLGNTEAIEDLGVNVNVAMLESTDAFKKFAGDKSWNQLDFQTQQQIRLFGILEQTTKKYGTEVNKNTSSSLQKVTAKFNNLTSNLTTKLLPIANKLIDKADKFIDKLDNLSEEEQENIIQIGLMVAAAGPLIKVIGTIGTTAGTVTKGIGTLSQAIGVLKTGAESSNVSVNNLAKILGGITSPAGLAVLGITAVTSALWILGQKSDESVIKMEKQIDVLEEQIKTLNSLKESQEEYLKTNLSEIENVQKLKKELETLVDENGRVKEGYEGRVKFILSELNEALGTEYDLTGDIINQYKDLTNSIDEVIAKKKASIILNSMEESYTNALKNRSDAIKNLAELEKTYSINKQKIIEKENEKLEFQKKKQDIFTLSRINKLNEEIKTLQENVNAHDEQKNKIIEYNTTIDEYETASAIIKEGNLEKIEELNNRYTNSYQVRKDETIASLAEQIQLESINLETQKETYNKTQSEITKKQLEESQNRLDALAQELVDATSTVNDLSPEQVTAWTNLAKGSYDKYSEELSQMEPTMQQKIQNMTGIIAGGTPQMQEKAEELGRKTVEEFDKSAEAKENALNTIEGYLKGLTDDEKRQLLEQAGIEDVDIVIDELNRGDLSEENGKNILQGLWNGLKNNTWQGKILGVASGLAQAVNKAFTGKDGWDEHSPSKKMKKFAEYYVQPISDVMKSKQKNIVSTAKNLANKLNSTFNTQMDLSQELDYEKMQSSLNKKIINGTSTIFTTPQIVFNVQELDETRLQQCFNYINRKFGSKY